MKLLISIFFILTSLTYAQRVAFISSDLIREKFPEAKRAEQRIQSNVDQWKRELENYQIKMDNIELDIKQNKLIWTDQELKDRNAELSMIKRERASYAASHFESGGDYDKLVKAVWEPIEQKIFAATSEVAAEQGFDFVFDKSLQPIPYTNYKYDLTLKVLEKLGYDISQLQRDLQKKIEADPRNQQKASKTPEGRRGRDDSRSRSRSRTDSRENQEMESDSIDKKPEGFVPPTDIPPSELPPATDPDEKPEGGGAEIIPNKKK